MIFLYALAYELIDTEEYIFSLSFEYGISVVLFFALPAFLMRVI